MSVLRRLPAALLAAMLLFPLHSVTGIDPPEPQYQEPDEAPTYVGLVGNDTLVWTRPVNEPYRVFAAAYLVYGINATGDLHLLKRVPAPLMTTRVPPGYADYAVAAEVDGKPRSMTWTCWQVSLDPPGVAIGRCQGASTAAKVLP